MLNSVRVISLSLATFLTIMYIIITTSIDPKGKLKRDLDNVFPPLYFVLFFMSTSLFLIPLGPNFQFQIIFALVSLAITVAIAYGIGYITKNGFVEKMADIKQIIYLPVEAAKEIWTAIKFALTQTWNAIVNFYNDVIFSFLSAFTDLYNVIADGVVEVANSFIGIFDAIVNMFSYFGDIISNIFTMGGEIPESKLPPAPPTPPFMKKSSK